jgi:hypothetical protein
MYLAIMLIVVAVLVFYNEINSKMNIAEIALLAISLIAIVRASLNYIQITDTTSIENFSSNNRSRKNGVKSRGKNRKDKDDFSQLESSDSSEYFDTDKNETSSTENKVDINSETDGKISADAVNQVNSLLGISRFNDLPTITNPSINPSINPSTTEAKLDSTIESSFHPQIIIGKGNFNGSFGLDGQIHTGNFDMLENKSASWQTAFSDDSMTFMNTMAPSTNLWGTTTSFGASIPSDDNSWTQSMNDYNNGRWNPNLYKRPSDYTDYYNPSAYGMSTPETSSSQQTKNNSTSNTKSNETAKRCGAYDDLSLDQAGNLVVRNYTEAKKWYPGYTYVPPVYWDVPQRHNSVCNPNSPNYQKLTGLVDRGLPINVLELKPDGTQADTEEAVKMSNVGSMMPRFNYQEQPFSKPYV